MIAALMLAGCMSGGGQARVPVGASGPAVAMPVTADVVCERAVRCGTIGRSQQEECRKGPGRSGLTVVWDGRPDRKRQVARGRVRLETTDARACLEFLASEPCRSRFPRGCGPEGPEPVVIGQVSPGGACEHGAECAGGALCIGANGESLCVARPPGSACGGDRDPLCSVDSFCWEGHCQRRAGAGGECREHVRGCVDGLFCEGYQAAGKQGATAEQLGRCSAGRSLGEDCIGPRRVAVDVCGKGLHCDWGSERPVCRERLPAGAECSAWNACAGELVCAGLVLRGFHPSGASKFRVHRPGRCAPTLDIGDACDPLAYVHGCPESMLCDPETRVCRSTGHAGDPCVPPGTWEERRLVDKEVTSVFEGCFSGHECDPDTRTCIPSVTRGP